MSNPQMKRLSFSDDNVTIGVAARFRLTQLVTAGEVSGAKKRKLLDCFRRYVVRIAQYLIANLPLDEEVISVARWLDPIKVSSLKVNDILNVAYRLVAIAKTLNL